MRLLRYQLCLYTFGLPASSPSLFGIEHLSRASSSTHSCRALGAPYRRGSHARGFRDKHARVLGGWRSHQTGVFEDSQVSRVGAVEIRKRLASGHARFRRCSAEAPKSRRAGCARAAKTLSGNPSCCYPRGVQSICNASFHQDGRYFMDVKDYEPPVSSRQVPFLRIEVVCDGRAECGRCRENRK